MITGYLSGVFDLFHVGHLNIIRRAKENCDYLIVGVSTDELCKSYKGHSPIIPFSERIRIVEAIKYVDMVIPQETLEKKEVVRKYKIDLIFHGNDAQNLELYKNIGNSVACFGTEIVLLPYTENVSSTIIKNKVADVTYNYRSLCDMDLLIRHNYEKIPEDIDFIVGVPRSGLIAAAIIATSLNIPLLGYEAILLKGNINTSINEKKWKSIRHYEPGHKYKVLLVDDSANEGKALNKIKELLILANNKLELITLTIYATQKASQDVDLCFEILEQPRFFEWNLHHSRILSKAIVPASLLFDMKKSGAVKPVFLKSIGAIFNDLNISKDELELKLNRNGIVGGICGTEKSYSEVYAGKREIVLAIARNDEQALKMHRETAKPVLSYFSAKIFK